MAKTEPPAKSPAKGGKMRLPIIALAMLGAGAGGAYGAVAMGVIGPQDGANEPDLPKLVRKGQEDPYAPPAKDGEAPPPAVDGEGGSEYRTAYHSFEEGFTSNLRDSPALIQVSLAASTRHDGRVLLWLDKHDLALRSAILNELAMTGEEEIFSIEGREKLQSRLAEALNAVLVEREGFGGVDNVYFRGLLVQ